MKKIVSSKWSKRILWFCILLTFSIWGYIVLFIGTANTYIDNVCLTICLISIATLIIRYFAIEYWQYAGGTGMTSSLTPVPTIENYMKSHIITNISNGTEELWNETVGEIPHEYYEWLVIKDEEGNIEALPMNNHISH